MNYLHSEQSRSSNCETMHYTVNGEDLDLGLPSRTESKTFSSKVMTTSKTPSPALSCHLCGASFTDKFLLSICKMPFLLYLKKTIKVIKLLQVSRDSYNTMGNVLSFTGCKKHISIRRRYKKRIQHLKSGNLKTYHRAIEGDWH